MAVWDQYMTDYNNSQSHQDLQKWQNATIQDVANKYGFNFSQDYANQQAEAAAQAKRNEQQAAQRTNQASNQQNIRSIKDTLKEGVIGTENSAFQQYLQKRQQQANNGLNAGIQADQNLRLGMNAQSALSGLYRDSARNTATEQQRYTLEQQKIQEALALVEQEKSAQAAKLYQDLLTQGYGLLGNERSWYNELDTKAYSQTQDRLSNYYKEQELAMAKARAAAQAAAERAARAKKAAKTTTTAPTTSAVNAAVAAFNAAKSAGSQTLADKYYSSVSARLNKGRDPKLTKIEDLPIVQRYLPNTINPNTDKNLGLWERNKIRFGI